LKWSFRVAMRSGGGPALTTIPFQPSTFRKKAYLRRYVYDFIQSLALPLTKKVVQSCQRS
jgi:hypothetical protein